MKVLKILYTTEFTYSAKNCSGRNEGCRTQLTRIKIRKTKTYMEKCKLTKTATSWEASLNLRKFSNKSESIKQSLKVLRASAFKLSKRFLRITVGECQCY